VSEKRRAKRYAKRLPADYKSPKKSGKGFTKNISRVGAYIESPPLGHGTLIDITLFLPNGKTPSMKGIVRHTDKKNGRDDEGMGIEFLDVDDEFIHFMQALSSAKRN
jgi:hypothetical protein